jgi:DNA-directed RNA polymerase sigma subunit (sigma70/sigma32)
MSHDEIAAVLQLSRQRVSQIEESALSKVRRRGLSLREFADA